MSNAEDHVNRTLNVQEKVDAFQAKCRLAGLKITPQRVAVYQALIESIDHPSAEVICREVRKVFPCISLDTVNRTLLTIYELGFALPVEGTGESRRYDGDMSNHQHFKCLKCKKITDIFDEDFGEIPVPDVLSDKKILRKTVYFEGICSECSSD